jgi:predicted acetyltransferase
VESGRPAVAPVHVPARPRLVVGRAGDHAAVHRFLLSVFHAPSATDFYAQLEEPLYEPTDRLLVKLGEHVVSHLRLTKRLIRFAGLSLAAAGFMDLGTDPEHRGRGYASALLTAGQQQVVAEGAILGLTRTTAPELFVRQGWSVCGRHSFSTASPRQILAYLCQQWPEEAAFTDLPPARPILLGGNAPPIVVRPLRRVELPAVMACYDQMAASAHGVPLRSAAYWDWLVGRSAFDRAYVAIEGSDRGEVPDLPTTIAGYAFAREGRLVEIVHSPAHERAGRALLARFCADCLERNLAQVRIDAPPGHTLHGLAARAGGMTQQPLAQHGQVHMARVFDPLALLRLLSDVLLLRAKEADLPRPLTLGLDLYHHDFELHQTSRDDVGSYRLIVGQRRVKLASGYVGRSYLSLTRRDMTPLLLGHWSAEEAIASGRIRASTRLAQEAARLLFPRLPWFRPPLDELLS